MPNVYQGKPKADPKPSPMRRPPPQSQTGALALELTRLRQLDVSHRRHIMTLERENRVLSERCAALNDTIDKLKREARSAKGGRA